MPSRELRIFLSSSTTRISSRLIESSPCYTVVGERRFQRQWPCLPQSSPARTADVLVAFSGRRRHQRRERDDQAGTPGGVVLDPDLPAVLDDDPVDDRQT